MMAVIAIFSIIASMVLAWLYCEIKDEDSTLRSWLWCRKHGFKLKSQIVGYGGGCEFWWGEDENGTQYVPDAKGNPKLVEKWRSYGVEQ